MSEILSNFFNNLMIVSGILWLFFNVISMKNLFKKKNYKYSTENHII
ncbi:hypothetical protein P689_122229 [Candidatus Riesia pediculischaeffi PTSU]|uniref:Uncharacterized protein n=1 Tax=Candidatus Riesia pediculischaeffi PTSU TaxID=1401651 RepID=A0A0C1RZN1_9ENTR|nr:hypothetical protein P689_122229 [Candidatus Riesia pediculischaeffi PTSU]